MLVTESRLTEVVNEVEKQVIKVFRDGVVSYLDFPVVYEIHLELHKDIDGRAHYDYIITARDVKTLVHLFNQANKKASGYKLKILAIDLRFRSVLLSESHYGTFIIMDNAVEIANQIKQSLPKNTFIDNIVVDYSEKGWGYVSAVIDIE